MFGQIGNQEVCVVMLRDVGKQWQLNADTVQEKGDWRCAFSATYQVEVFSLRDV